MKSLTLFIALVLCSSVFALKDRTKRDPSYAMRSAQVQTCELMMPRQLSKILFKRINRQVSTIDYALISHSNLIVLEFLDISNFDNCIREERYPTKTQFCEIYQLKDQTLWAKYKNLIGEPVYLYDHYFKRKQYHQQIIDVVLVYDRHQDKPYVAAVTDIDQKDHIYYAWASSEYIDMGQFGKKNILGYENSETDEVKFEDVINTYKQAAYYIDYEANVDEKKADDYARIDVTEFESIHGHYFILENKSVGVCEFLNENHLILYQYTKGKYQFIASGNIDQELVDMVDINNDGYPEIITGAFTSSSIYQFEGRKMNLLKSASWSFEGCPC